MLSRRHLLMATSAALPLPALLACQRRQADEPAPAPKASLVTAARMRDVTTVLASQPTSDGAGVKLNRAIGGRALGMLDPFLLLDEFQTDDPNDYIAGFPDHPHRGFETVTYMIHGAMEHKDSVGNRGRLRPGSAQWMTAGRGIIHSEMPKQERGLMWGFQLWVNLPAAHKMVAPRYQDIAPERIPEIDRDGAHVRVVAGSALGATGPVAGIDVEPIFLDVTLTKGAAFSHELPGGHTAFVYVTDGAVRVGPSRREVRRGHVAVLGPGELFASSCDSEGARYLLIAGKPLREPVARYGPFVMSTDDEIRQAFDDYRSGRLVGS